MVRSPKFTHYDITVTNVSLPALAAKLGGRYYLLLRNTGSQTISLRVDGGVAVADNTSIPLLPGETHVYDRIVPDTAINAIVSAGTATLHVLAGEI